MVSSIRCSSRLFRGLCAALVLLCLGGAGAASGSEDIRVPFNFQWGDSPQVVEDTITRAKARVVDRRTQGGRRVLVVEGHPDPRLQRSVFYFDSDALSEVELQYGDPSWDGPKIGAIFEQTRRNLDRKYGTGRNIARQKMQEGRTVQTVVGYQWTQSYTSLRLFLYTAEQGAETFRMLSYHYRGF